MEENISQVQPVEAPLKQPKPWLKITLFSILGLVLAGGLIFAGIQIGKRQVVPFSVSPTPVPSSVVTPVSAPPATPTSISLTTPTIDPTANWKTYTDEKLGVSIKYPSDIVVLRSIPGDMVMFTKNINSKKDFRYITTLDINFRGEVGTTPEQALKGECPTREGESCQEKFEKVTINNAIGIRTLGPNYPYEDNYYLTINNKTSKVVRLFIFPKGDNPTEGLEIFKEMVETFKFLE